MTLISTRKVVTETLGQLYQQDMVYLDSYKFKQASE